MTTQTSKDVPQRLTLRKPALKPARAEVIIAAVKTPKLRMPKGGK